MNNYNSLLRKEQKNMSSFHNHLEHQDHLDGAEDSPKLSGFGSWWLGLVVSYPLQQFIIYLLLLVAV